MVLVSLCLTMWFCGIWGYEIFMKAVEKKYELPGDPKSTQYTQPIKVPIHIQKQTYLTHSKYYFRHFLYT